MTGERLFKNTAMMNVYDFDNTIYDGDSTVDFYLFCLKKYPYLLRRLPFQLHSAIKYKMGKISKTKFKEDFFCFLRLLPDTEAEVKLFWDKHESRIMEWYKKRQQADDVIISASPYFLLSEICKRLNIQNLIASMVDWKTGKFAGGNCYGEEKWKRWQEIFPETGINEFYSDSYSDERLAKAAKRAYLVKKGRILPWQQYKK